MEIKFHRTYTLITTIILLTEIIIAIYIKTGFTRHTFGDFLATILVFSFFKSFLKVNTIKLGISVLVFAFGIELMQFIDVLDFLNINNRIIRIILGTTFQASDLIAYTLGTTVIVLIDIKLFNNEQHKTIYI